MTLPAPRADACALVTGASSGIGVAFARALARRGHNLALAARRGDRLEALAAELRDAHRVEVLPVPTDLSDVAARHALLERAGAVDILVNNAGLGFAGSYLAHSAEAETQMIRLNVEAPAHLCRALAPPMVQRSAGAILNVGSIASFHPLPGMSAYAGTKSFVLNFTAGLHSELRGTGVAVTALCPGSTTSEFAAVAGGAAIAERLPAALTMSSDAVAEAGLQALDRNRWLCVPGRFNAAFAFAGRHVPRRPLLWAASQALSRATR